MKKSFWAKSSSLALAATLAGTSAFAQSAVEVLQDTIVVTGTKKADAENVQDVALSVTAYGDEQLDALKVRDISSLTTAIPNVSFDDIGTVKGYANFSIRGLGINSSIPSIDPTVGIFYDGIYLGVPAGAIFDIFDLESIEVLRGPQGILFGRNVTGGAVLVNTKRPPSEFEASFKGAVESGLRGTGNNYYAMGAVGGPIIEDFLNARVSAYYNDDQGWHQNFNPTTQTFDDFGKSDTFVVRPSFSITPTDDLEVLVRYEHGEINAQGPAAQNHTNGSGVTNPAFSASRDSFLFSIDELGFSNTNWDGVTSEIKLNVPFGDGVITNIFGWRDLDQETASDIDATPAFIFHSTAAFFQDQLSNEIRYNGRFGDMVDVTAGFYYFTQDVIYNEGRRIAGGAVTAFGGGVQDHSTIGAFLNFDIGLTDNLVLNLGGRYSNEKKDVVVSNLLLNQTLCDVGISGDCSEDFVDGDRWTNFNPKVGLQYTPRDDLNIYAHWTQAVRSGGYNFRNTSAFSIPFAPNPTPPPALVPNPNFNPDFLPGPTEEETVNAFEIGMKAQPGDGIATINAAIYYNDINNMQRELNLADPGLGVTQIIRNTADATIWGIEIDAKVALTDNLLLNGSIGHTDGNYDKVLFDISSDGLVNEADLALEIPRLAPWTYNVGFVHYLPLSEDIDVNTRFNYSHRDRSFYTDNNLGVLNEIDIIDASVAVSTFDGRVTFSLYGKNLLNENNFGGDTQLPASLGGGTFSPLNKGRVVGIELQLSTN